MFFTVKPPKAVCRQVDGALSFVTVFQPITAVYFIAFVGVGK